MKVYLAGAINGCTDDEAMDWRTYIKSKLDCETLDPMRRDYRGIEHDSCEEIVALDIHDINESDLVLVHAVGPSWGTAMEIFYTAYVAKKPVILIDKQNRSLSPWLKHFCKYVVGSEDEAIRLIYILKD